MKIILTPLTIGFVFRICVLFIIRSFVPIPDGLWDQTFINIPLRISAKRPHKASLYRSCVTNFITRPFPIVNNVISAQRSTIASQFPFFSRINQSITTVHIKRVSCLDKYHNKYTVLIRKLLQKQLRSRSRHTAIADVIQCF